MKKFTGILLCAVLISLLSASCGGNTEKETKAKTTAFEPDSLVADYYENTETQTNGDTTTAKADVIKEKSSGISFLTATTTAKVGNSCGISVMGDPDTEFSIQIYNDEKTLMKADGLKTVTSDKNGVASWSFIIPEGTATGSKVVIVRQANSENYARTALVVTQ